MIITWLWRHRKYSTVDMAADKERIELYWVANDIEIEIIYL